MFSQAKKCRGKEVLDKLIYMEKNAPDELISHLNFCVALLVNTYARVRMDWMFFLLVSLPAVFHLHFGEQSTTYMVRHISIRWSMTVEFKKADH